MLQSTINRPRQHSNEPPTYERPSILLGQFNNTKMDQLNASDWLAITWLHSNSHLHCSSCYYKHFLTTKYHTYTTVTCTCLVTKKCFFIYYSGMDTDDSTPLHVHVDDATPVHVHVRKPKKPLSSTARTSDLNNLSSRSHAMHSTSNLRRSTHSATAKAHSKSTGQGPWIPPPAKSTKPGSKYSWQGPSHRLEISGQRDRDCSPTTRMRMAELDTDDEDKVSHKARSYEKKIDSLMSEVGSLRNEVELHRALRDNAKKDEVIHSQSRVFVDKENELEDNQRKLRIAEAENMSLRRSTLGTGRPSLRECEQEHLMKMLVEVEMDGQAAAKHVAALKDLIKRMKDGRISSSDSAVLMKQKELLMERLADFEATNLALRQVLRDRHEDEATSLCLAEQRDILLKKLSETEDVNQKLRRKLLDKDEDVAQLTIQINAQRDENVAINSLQSSLESTRAHLQKQLRQKEADCNRMAVQVRTIESQLAQEHIEVDHLQELLITAKEKSERDKESLKKATRTQKQRAARNEDAVENLNAQMLERENILTEVRSELDGARSTHDKLAKEKAQAISEKSSLQTRVAELEHIVERLEDDSKAKVDAAMANSHEKKGEVADLQLENDRLTSKLSNLENKLSNSEAEITGMRGSVRQYETLVDEYRNQMNKLRQEADESLIQLEESKFEVSRTKREGDHELERLEQQADRVDQVRDQFIHSQDRIRSLEAKISILEHKLQDVEDQNHTLVNNLSKKEETTHQLSMQLDEKVRENASIARQLETLLADARRQTEQSRSKVSERERTSQARILELESQISQMRTDLMKIKREKDDGEKKFNSRLYDIKDRLEQSHSTNRSMQNYVQFLKNSYANVFGDSSVSATPQPQFRTSLY